jgi:hypothetical protein
MFLVVSGMFLVVSGRFWSFFYPPTLIFDSKTDIRLPNF